MNITYKNFIYLLIATIMALALLYICTITIIEFVKSDKPWIDTTIGALGNIAGGIIGGVVAYIVASYQVKVNNQQEQSNILRNTYANIRLIAEEINYNLNILEAVIPYENDNEQDLLLEKELQNIQWYNCSTNLGPEISNDCFDLICGFYRRIAILKNMDSKNRNSDYIEKTRDKAKIVLDELHKLTSNINKKI